MKEQNKCVICGKNIPNIIGRKTCGLKSKCYNIHSRLVQREYQKKPTSITYQREYHSVYRYSPKYKKYQKEYQKKYRKAVVTILKKHRKEFEKLLK